MRRTVLTAAALLGAGVVALAFVTDRRADLREAGIEARYPPEGEIVQVNGRDVHVVVKGRGPDLVLIHGASGNAREFTSSLTDKLADRYRLFVVDRPGHGWSARLDPADESPLAQARVLAEATRSLRAENPIVFGHSFGGAVTMAWGLEANPSALVVLAGVTLPWPGDVGLTYRVLGNPVGATLLAPLAAAFVPENYARQAADSAFAPQEAPDNYFSLAGIPLAIRTETLRATNRQVNVLRPQIVEQSARYEQIDIPVEILHGTEDKTVYAEIHAEPLADMLPDANLTILDGIGHMPHHAVPGDVIAAIDRAASRAGLR